MAMKAGIQAIVENREPSDDGRYDLVIVRQLAPVAIQKGFGGGMWVTLVYDRSVRSRVPRIAGKQSQIAGIFLGPATDTRGRLARERSAVPCGRRNVAYYSLSAAKYTNALSLCCM